MLNVLHSYFRGKVTPYVNSDILSSGILNIPKDKFQNLKQPVVIMLEMKVRLLDIYAILSEYCDVDYTWETQEIDKREIIIRDKLFIMHIKRNGVQAQTNNM